MLPLDFSEALWKRWCRDHPPKKDQAKNAKALEKALETHSLLMSSDQDPEHDYNKGIDLVDITPNIFRDSRDEPPWV